MRVSGTRCARAAPQDHHQHLISRRIALQGIASLSASQLLVNLQAEPATAALAQFPADQLKNQYFLVRAGENYAESDGIVQTNPVWKTSQRIGLNAKGIQQIRNEALPSLEALGACTDSCWIWPSITQNSYMAAEIIAYDLGMGRSRIVPEYSFLDMRGYGALEDMRLEDAMQVLSAGDALDPDWRPQKGTDGTPHESLQDIYVRMRQMLSITETQYTGENIIIIGPDSFTLSILQAAVLGVDIRGHQRFAMRHGQLHLTLDPKVRPLELAAKPFDASPRQFRCYNPPKCDATAPAPGATGTGAGARGAAPKRAIQPFDPSAEIATN